MECLSEQCSMSPQTDVYKDKDAPVRIWNNRKAKHISTGENRDGN